MKRGFTLLELMIVIVIIGILAAIGIPRYFDAIQQAKKAEALGTLLEIRKIEQAVMTTTGSYLTADDSLNGDTIGADLDGDSTNDIALTVPNSTTFTYKITAAKAIANRQAATKSKKSYQMDLAAGTIEEKEGTY